MANYYGRAGAPMIQPTKDEYRGWLKEARDELRTERRRRERAEYRLGIATRKLGRLVVEGKIDVPADKLGEVVLRMAMDEEVEQEVHEPQALLVQG